MDPICHTLAGAALGCTGLQKRSRFGRATLIIAANLPDVDAVTYLVDGVDSLGIRRGVTHGVPALVVLPVLLALTMKVLSMDLRGPPGKTDADFRQLWLLSAVGMATHPFLDYLNNYGMRWLMPFVDRWVYGDTLYIVDPFVWVILLAGVILTAAVNGERTGRRNPAAIALAATGAYIALNAGGTLLARHATVAALQDDPPSRLMASPVLMRPLERRLVLEYEHLYRVGKVDLFPALSVEVEDLAIPKGDPRDLARAAATGDGRVFLHWARFPFSESKVLHNSRVIRVMDARYVREWEDDFGAIEVNVPVD